MKPDFECGKGYFPLLTSKACLDSLFMPGFLPAEVDDEIEGEVKSLSFISYFLKKALMDFLEFLLIKMGSLIILSESYIFLAFLINLAI